VQAIASRTPVDWTSLRRTALGRRGVESAHGQPWWEVLQDAQEEIAQMPLEDEEDRRKINAAWKAARSRVRKGTARRARWTGRTTPSASGAPIWCGKRCRSVGMSTCMRYGFVWWWMPIMRSVQVSARISNDLATTYALTDRRAIIIGGGLCGQRAQSFYPGQVEAVACHEHSDSTGDVLFSTIDGNIGEMPGFSGIADAQHVAHLAQGVLITRK
jgi:hypothetical protein